MSMLSRSVYLVGCKRTPFGAFGGKLKDFTPTHLAELAGRSALVAANVKPENVDSVIVGCVIQCAHTDTPYVSRHTLLRLGIPIHVPALTVNRLCGSGFQSIINGAQEIVLGDSQIVLAAGTENMSMSPYVVRNIRFGTKLGGQLDLEDSLWQSLTDGYIKTPMGITAENLAEKYQLTREQCDAFAHRSQTLWRNAQNGGHFKEEMVPVTVKGKKGDVVVDVDEHPRETTPEQLAKLPAVFKKNGTVSAGNASGVCDGAGAVVLASEEAVKKYNLKPLARLVSYSTVGCDPKIMGIGPVEAVRNILKSNKLTLNDIDLVEVNEAFAPQTIAVAKELGLDENKLNVNGGAIALGHPLAASGSRITAHLVHELRRRKAKRAIGSACIGGGQGVAILIETMNVDYASLSSRDVLKVGENHIKTLTEAASKLGLKYLQSNSSIAVDIRNIRSEGIGELRTVIGKIIEVQREIEMIDNIMKSSKEKLNSANANVNSQRTSYHCYNTYTWRITGVKKFLEDPKLSKKSDVFLYHDYGLEAVVKLQSIETSVYACIKFVTKDEEIIEDPIPIPFIPSLTFTMKDPTKGGKDKVKVERHCLNSVFYYNCYYYVCQLFDKSLLENSIYVQNDEFTLDVTIESQVNTRTSTTTNGILSWTIDNYSQMKQRILEGLVNNIASPYFYTAKDGYRVMATLTIKYFGELTKRGWTLGLKFLNSTNKPTESCYKATIRILNDDNDKSWITYIDINLKEKDSYSINTLNCVPAEKGSFINKDRLQIFVSLECDPKIMGIGPVKAVRNILRNNKLTLNDIDLVEVNEAFAPQTMAVAKELGLDENKLNVNGGAIALGYPLAASGSRITAHLVHELSLSCSDVLKVGQNQIKTLTETASKLGLKYLQSNSSVAVDIRNLRSEGIEESRNVIKKMIEVQREIEMIETIMKLNEEKLNSGNASANSQRISYHCHNVYTWRITEVQKLLEDPKFIKKSDVFCYHDYELEAVVKLELIKNSVYAYIKFVSKDEEKIKDAIPIPFIPSLTYTIKDPSSGGKDKVKVERHCLNSVFYYNCYYYICELCDKSLLENSIYVQNNEFTLDVTIESQVNTRTSSSSNGILSWTIDNYSQMKQRILDGLVNNIASPYFYTEMDGYRMQATLTIGDLEEFTKRGWILGLNFLNSTNQPTESCYTVVIHILNEDDDAGWMNVDYASLSCSDVLKVGENQIKTLTETASKLGLKYLQSNSSVAVDIRNLRSEGIEESRNVIKKMIEVQREIEMIETIMKSSREKLNSYHRHNVLS
ncbi:acetyl-CoA acyltransferase 2 [Chamberlinius hualienensis]